MPRRRPRKTATTNSETADNLLELNADNVNGFLKPQDSRYRGAHKCDVCSQTFPKYNQLQRHLREHEENDKPYRCDQCPTSFNMEINLVLHKATHNANDPVCPVCFKKFSRVASLKAHIMLHEKEENLICTECGNEFTLQSELSRHLEEHRQELNGSRVHICKICTKEFDRPSQLREHMKSHNRVRSSLCTKQYKRHVDRSGFSHRCEHCEKTFQKPSQLIRHIRIHTGERPFKCGDCGKAFSQKGTLQIHMIKHTGEKTHFCGFCPASFSQSGNLQAHIQRVHTEVKNGDQPAYQCEECSCVFRKLGSLNAHISRMHSDESESSRVITYTVHSVPQALENSGLTTIPIQAHQSESGQPRASLSRSQSQDAPTTRLQQTQSSTPQSHHQRMEKLSGKENVDVVKKMMLYPGSVRQVNGIRWYMCTYCTKESKKPSDLVRHIRIHTHEKPYKCTQCFWAFSQKSTLTAHLKIHLKSHTAINAFRCPICPRMFSTQGSLKVHFRHHPGSVRLVNGIRWRMCTYCTKEFKKPSDFVQHIRTHTHEKPYKCTQCFRAFAVKSTLTTHMKTHIKTHTCIKEFRCPMCAKMFSTQGSLKVHLQLHTGDRPFDCPHCDNKFRTFRQSKSHIASHFKNLQLKKRIPRKPAKTRILKNSITLTDIPLQDPLLITESGLYQQTPRKSQ